ncbi:MAG: histidinol-phosphatase [Dictyoglomus turgidum]
MLIDYHMHLERGPFEENWWLKFYEKAKERNIKELGISEHGHRFKEFRPIYNHLPITESWCDSNLYEYKEFTMFLKKKYNLKIGLEMDYFPEKEKEIKELLQEYNFFDYVLGSVHFIDQGFGFDIYPNDPRWTERDIEEIFEDYFDKVEKLIKSNLFDVIAHLDVVKLWGVRKPKNLNNLYEKIAKVIINSNISLELNTAGWRKPVNEVYPSPEFLRILAPYDVPLTFGADAHTPEDVGRDIQKAYNLAKELGFKKLSIFNKRDKIVVDL